MKGAKNGFWASGRSLAQNSWVKSGTGGAVVVVVVGMVVVVDVVVVAGAQLARARSNWALPAARAASSRAIVDSRAGPESTCDRDCSMVVIWALNAALLCCI